MARYDRDFLVPYLHDVCALYMAVRKLDQKVSEKNQLIKQYSAVRKIYPPEKPVLEEEKQIGCLGVFAGCFSLMGVILLLGIVFDPGGIGSMPIAVGVLLGLFATISGWIVFKSEYISEDEIKDRNEQIEKEYLEAQRRYEEELQQIEWMKAINRPKVLNLQKEINELYSQKNEAVHVRNQLYAANIIPSPYRNIYAAVYLYRWFSTSESDDLDHALGMFVLEEIKSKLDVVIEQEAEIILNQRLMMANQHRSMEMQKEHHRDLMTKLSSIQATEEERLRYEKMTEANTAATAFFTTANYLK